MHSSDVPARRRRTLVALVAAAAFVVAGCSGGDGGQRGAATSTAAAGGTTAASSAPGGTTAPVGQLSASPAHTWGSGRALGAATAADGVLAVVTTTGAYAIAQPGADPVSLEQFATPLQVGPVAVSPDSTTFAIVTNPPSVRLYDLTAGTAKATYDLPADVSIRSVDYAPTGRLVVDTSVGPFASADATTAPQPLVNAPAGKTAILPNGTLVTPITGTTDLAVSGPGTTERHTLTLAGGATVLDAQVSPNGSVVAVSAGAGENVFERQDQVIVLDAATLEQRAVIDTGRALDPAQWAVTDEAVVAADGTSLDAWAFTGAHTSGAAPTQSEIAGLRPVPGGLVTVQADGTLVRWSPAAADPAVVGNGGAALQSVTTGGDGTTLTTVDWYGRVSTVNATDGAVTASDDRFGAGEATDVTIAPDGSRIGVATSTGHVSVLDPDLAEQWTFETAATPERVGAVAFDPSGTSLATGLAERRGPIAFDDSVALWNLQQRDRTFHIDGKSEDVDGCSFFYSRIRFSPDGTTMAVSSHDFSVVVLDAATGEVRKELPGVTTILDLAFSPDGALLVATYDDGTVNVWNTADYSLAATYRAATGGQQAIAIMPDSTTMVTTDITGAISLVDVMTGDLLRSFADARYRTSTLALSADGALLASPLADGSIAIWSTASGEQLTTLLGHTAPATGLAFSPDGSWLVSSSSDGTVRTWTLTRG